MPHTEALLSSELSSIRAVANVVAQDVLAFSVDEVRGRPLADLLDQSIDLVWTLRRVLETGECIADREHPVRPLGSPGRCQWAARDDHTSGESGNRHTPLAGILMPPKRGAFPASTT